MNPAGDTLVGLAQLGATPISPERPGGESIRYDADFEALRVEVEKLESPDALLPDWTRVAEIAHGLLATRSKDVLVACYLAVALLHRDGYAGLTIGVGICDDLVRYFWPDFFPEATRLKGRAAAFAWLAERGAQAVGRRAPTGPERESVRLVRERVNSLSAALEDAMGADAPSLGELTRALEVSERELPSELPPVSATPARPSSAPEEAPGEIESEEALDRTLDRAAEWLRRSADYLARTAPADPQAYRLARLSAWLRVAEAPADDGGDTQIPGPQPEDLGLRYQESLDRGEWQSVLEEAESRFPSAVLWLDLQRFVAEALTGLGPECAPAACAVAAETAALVARIPGLVDLRFVNGVPLADERTKVWLASQAQGNGAPEKPRDDDMEEAAREARKLAASGKFGPAAAMLAARAEAAPNRRARAERRLLLARLCLENGRHRAALGQLEALDEELRSAPVIEWEPALGAEVIKNLLAALARMAEESPSAETEERVRALYRRLCRLDVAGALALDGRKGS